MNGEMGNTRTQSIRGGMMMMVIMMKAECPLGMLTPRASFSLCFFPQWKQCAVISTVDPIPACISVCLRAFNFAIFTGILTGFS